MESQSEDDTEACEEERAVPRGKTMSVASSEDEMRQFEESEAEVVSENVAVRSDSNSSNKTGGRNSTVSTISMDQSSTFDFNEPVLATHSMIMKQKIPVPVKLRGAIPSRHRRSQIYDPDVESSSDSTDTDDDSSTFDLNKSVKASDSIINKHTQPNFKRPTKPRHEKSAVESSKNSTKSDSSDSVNSDSNSGSVTESTWERGLRQIGQKRIYKPQVERRRKTASVEIKSDSFPVPGTSATTSLTNPQKENKGNFKEPLAGGRLRIPSPASTIIVMSPERVESLHPANFSFSASGVSPQMFPSASKARQVIANENSSVSFSSNVNPSSYKHDSDGTTASEEEEEEVGVDKLSSKTHVTGTTSSGEQEQMPGHAINNSSQIIDENLDPDNSLLEANTDDDDLLGSEITTHETRDSVLEPPTASAILNENSFGVANVASSRSFQAPISANFGGSSASGSEMSSACPSVVQRTASEYFALLEMALRNSQNIPYYEVSTDTLGSLEFPMGLTFVKLKSAFINPGVLIPSNERLLAETAQSLATEVNEPKNPEPIDESSDEEVLEDAPNQIERRGFKRKPSGMRVRSSSLLRRHPSEIYSGIGNYIQRTNSQISNSQGSSQRSAISAPVVSDQFREEISHSGEYRDEDLPVNSIREGPITIGITEVEASEARLSSGSTRSEKLSVDKIRSRTLEAIPESSPPNSPKRVNSNNILEMDVSAAESANVVVANSTRVSTRQTSVTNQSERIRSTSHKRMQKLGNDNYTRETGNIDTGYTNNRSSLPDPQAQIEDVFQEVIVSSKEAVDSVLDSERQSNSTFTKVIRADPTIGSKSIKSPSAIPQSSVSFKNSPQANASMEKSQLESNISIPKTSENHAPIPSSEGSSKNQGKRGRVPASTLRGKHLSLAESSSDENDAILGKSQRSAASKRILRNRSQGSVNADIDEPSFQNSKNSAASRIASIAKSSRVNKYSSSGEELHDATGSGKIKHSQSKKRLLAIVDSSDSDEEMNSRTSKNTLNKKRPPYAENSDDDLLGNTITRSSSSAKSQLIDENSDHSLQETEASKIKNYSRKNSSFVTENTDCNADSNGRRNSRVKSFSNKTNRSSNQLQPLTSSRTASLQVSESQQLLRKESSRDPNIGLSLFADDSGMQRNKQESDMHRSNGERVLRLPSESESESPAPSRTSSPQCSPKVSPAKLVLVGLADETETAHLAHRSCSEPENVVVIAKDIDLRVEDADEESAISNIISVIDSQIRETPHRQISGRLKSSKISFEKSPERHPTSTGAVYVEKSQSNDDRPDASVDKETSHCENVLLAQTSPKKKSSGKSPSFIESKQASVVHSAVESSSSISNKSQTRSKRKSTMTPGSSDNDSVSLRAKKSYSKRGRMAESVDNSNSADLRIGGRMSALTSSNIADNQAAPVDVAIIEEDISAGKKSATRKRKLVGNTQEDHDTGSQGRVNLTPSVASSEIPGTSRGSRFETKSTKKAPTLKPKKDFGYYRNNAGIVKKEHVMAGLQVIGVKANKSRVEALTEFASKELENMLDELMASTTKDRNNGVFTYRELELALKRRKLLDPDLGKNALLLHMASVWDRTEYDKAKGVLLPKPGSYNT